MKTRIQELRKKKNISQEELANVMNVSRQAVSKWENDLTCPDISLLPQMATYFHISIDELLCGEKKEVQLVPVEERKDFNKMLLKIRVLSEGDKVNINLPLPLLKAGIELGMQMPQMKGNDAIKDIDFSSIIMLAEQGAIGKLVEVESENGDIVEITIE